MMSIKRAKIDIVADMLFALVGAGFLSHNLVVNNAAWSAFWAALVALKVRDLIQGVYVLRKLEGR